MIVNESAENYLETILILSRKLPVVRSVDIANELGFTWGFQGDRRRGCLQN